MGIKRRLAVFSMVMLAIHESLTDVNPTVYKVVYLSLQYGKSIKIKRKEILEVLNMRVKELIK